MSYGTISARVYTSTAQIPIQNAGFGVTTKENGVTELIGFRFTDENGRTTPIQIQTPEVYASKAPNNGTPYSLCDVRIVHPEYETVLVENVQVFPGIETIQDVEMVPLPEDPLLIDEIQKFVVTAQNL